MKKLSKLLVGLLSLATVSSAFAAPQKAQQEFRPYFSAKGGFLFPETVRWGGNKQDFKMGGAYSLSCGVKWQEWRFEVEGTHKHAEIKDPEGNQACTPKMSAPGAFVNVFYDYELNEEWSWYIGAGAGFAVALVRANIHGTTPVDRHGKIVFAAQAMTGFEYHMNENIAWSLGYKMLPPTRVEYGTLGGTNTYGGKSPLMHIVELGIRYTF